MFKDMSAYDWAILTGQIIVIAGVIYWYNLPTPSTPSADGGVDLSSWERIGTSGNNNNWSWPKWPIWGNSEPSSK